MVRPPRPAHRLRAARRHRPGHEARCPFRTP